MTEVLSVIIDENSSEDEILWGFVFEDPQHFGFYPVTDIDQYDADADYDYVELIVHDPVEREHIRIRAKIDIIDDELAGIVSVEIVKPIERIVQDWEVVEEVF
jgi:hypothetical protein